MSNSKKKSSCVVIYPNTNSFCKYFGKVIKGFGPDVIGFFKWENLFYMNFLRLLSLFNLKLPNFLTWGKWKNHFDYHTVLLFADVMSRDVILHINKIYGKSRKILYFWNVANCRGLNDILEKGGWEIWSFDKKQTEYNGWNFVGQFYGKLKCVNENTPRKYDFFFCGYNKNRAEKLLDLISVFNENNLSYKCIVREWGVKNFLTSFKNAKLRRYITFFETDYLKYLKILVGSRCLIDIVQVGQIGLTMRMMESLFYNKKIVTNNIDVINYNFYNKKNIFVFGIDDVSTLKTWLSIPYDSSVEIFQKDYCVETWYRKMNIDLI